MYISRLERDDRALEFSPGQVPNSDRRVVPGPWLLPKENFGSGSIALVLRGWGPREIKPRRSWRFTSSKLSFETVGSVPIGWCPYGCEGP